MPGNIVTPVLERLARKSVVDESTGCWIWQGGRDSYGNYGKITDGHGVKHFNHRLSWTEFRGEIPDGLHIDHLCRNKLCWNPDHLEPVTQQINNRRAWAAVGHNMGKRTHCKNGHEFSSEPALRGTDNGRLCRQCRRDYTQKYRSKMKERATVTHVLEDEFDEPGESENPNEVKRDRYGRPMLPKVNLGAVKASGDLSPFTRCTTFAGSLDEQSNLSLWSQRLVVKGMAERDDLRLLARSATLEDKATLNEVITAAKEMAGGPASARLGTALHSFTEIRDRGGSNDDIDPEMLPRVDAYSEALKTHGIEILPDYIERLVCWEKYSVSGTFDRIVMYKGSPVICDLKTGKDLGYGWLKIAVQLLCYAMADGIWSQPEYRWHPLPEGLRQDIGLVVHLPSTGDVSCTVYEVDLLPAVEAARICSEVREWRKTRGLETKLKIAPISDAVFIELKEDQTDPTPRLTAESREQLEELQAALPKPKRGRPRKKVEPVVEVLEGAALDAEVKASGAPIGRCTYCGNEHVEMMCPEAPKDDNWVWPWAKPQDAVYEVTDDAAETMAGASRDLLVEVTTTETEIAADVALIVEDDDPFANLPEENLAMTPEEEYRLRIMDAASPGELSVIRKEAMDSGAWSDALLELGMARLAELKK